jgi:hypothetical protein
MVAVFCDVEAGLVSIGLYEGPSHAYVRFTEPQAVVVRDGLTAAIAEIQEATNGQ